MSRSARKALARGALASLAGHLCGVGGLALALGCGPRPAERVPAAAMVEGPADSDTMTGAAAEDEAEVPGPPLFGEPCAVPGERVCVELGLHAAGGGPGILECVDGRWFAITGCPEECAAENACSAGCGVIRGEEGPRCLCVPAGPACPGQPYCRFHEQLRIPDPAGGEDEEVSCVAECTAIPEGFSLGCGFVLELGTSDCLCAALGEACDAGQRSRGCVGPAESPTGRADSATPSIAVCDQGQWTERSCAELCSDPMAQCWRRFKEQDACSCEV